MIQSNELVFGVDENNNPTHPQKRSEVHANGYWHRVSHVFLVTKKGEILCQKRSLKVSLSPGMWQPVFGGHLGPEMSYKDGAVRELKEELGIEVNSSKLQLLLIHKFEYGYEFQAVFVYEWDGDVSSMQLEDDEVEAIEKVKIDDLKSKIKDGTDKWVFMGYEKEAINKIGIL